jgi:phosphoinositide-3-kinase regulatory subunit 4
VDRSGAHKSGTDEEEFIIAKSLRALTTLVELQLVNAVGVLEIARKAAPMLCHPSAWIRFGTACPPSTVARFT